MKKIISVILCCFFLVGCYTYSKIDKKINKFNDKNPEATVKVIRKLYPVKVDSGSIKRDTFYVNRPINLDSLKRELAKGLPSDTVFKPDSSCVKKADSLVKYIAKQNKAIKALENELKNNPKVIEVIVPQEDSAKIKEAYIERDKALQKVEDEKKSREKLESKHKRVSNFMWVFLVLFLLSVIGNILQLKLKPL